MIVAQTQNPLQREMPCTWQVSYFPFWPMSLSSKLGSISRSQHCRHCLSVLAEAAVVWLVGAAGDERNTCPPIVGSTKASEYEIRMVKNLCIMILSPYDYTASYLVDEQCIIYVMQFARVEDIIIAGLPPSVRMIWLIFIQSIVILNSHMWMWAGHSALATDGISGALEDWKQAKQPDESERPAENTQKFYLQATAIPNCSAHAIDLQSLLSRLWIWIRSHRWSPCGLGALPVESTREITLGHFRRRRARIDENRWT